MANPFDYLEQEEENPDFIESLGTPEDKPAIPPSEKEQKDNMRPFDQPIPGQSLAGEQGNAKYEQPPQYTDVSEFMDYVFDSVSRPKVRRDLLRMLDAGVPVRLLVAPVLMQAINEGKINMDVAMLSAKPLATILGGMGEYAGINVVRDGRPDEPGIDARPFKKAFKENREKDEPVVFDEEDSLVSRRDK